MPGRKTPAVIMQGSDTMKSWQLAVLGLAPLLIAGCRTDPAIPILERELYRKDQEINRLRWQIEDMQGVANCCPEQSTVRDRCGEEREPEPRSYRNHRGPDGLRPTELEPEAFRFPRCRPISANPVVATDRSASGPMLEGRPRPLLDASRSGHDGLGPVGRAVPSARATAAAWRRSPSIRRSPAASARATPRAIAACWSRCSRGRPRPHG